MVVVVLLVEGYGCDNDGGSYGGGGDFGNGGGGGCPEPKKKNKGTYINMTMSSFSSFLGDQQYSGGSGIFGGG